LDFAKFILVNFQEDCFNITDFANDFWYIWVSNGKQGFLLDLIKAPDHLELRLDIYDASPGVNPVVVRQFLNLTDLSISEDGANIKMGPVTLTLSSCVGSVGGVDIDVSFALSNRSNDFVPAWIENIFPPIPDFQSTYGAIDSASCNGTTYAPGLPIVYSKYPVRLGIDYWQWCLLSLMSLTPASGSLGDQDPIQVEIAGTLIADLWVVTSFVYYEGKQHHFDDPFLLETRLTSHGQISNDTRVFGATIKGDEGRVDFEINCNAPLDKFAMLDRDGNTEIHTTLLGQCTLMDRKKDQQYFSNSALLELKQKFTNSSSMIFDQF